MGRTLVHRQDPTGDPEGHAPLGGSPGHGTSFIKKAVHDDVKFLVAGRQLLLGGVSRPELRGRWFAHDAGRDA